MGRSDSHQCFLPAACLRPNSPSWGVSQLTPHYSCGNHHQHHCYTTTNATKTITQPPPPKTPPTPPHHQHQLHAWDLHVIPPWAKNPGGVSSTLLMNYGRFFSTDLEAVWIARIGKDLLKARSRVLVSFLSETHGG